MNSKTYTIIFDELDTEPDQVLAMLNQLIHMAGALTIRDALVVETSNQRVITILDALFPDLAGSSNGRHTEEDAAEKQAVHLERTPAEEWQPAGKPAKPARAPKAAKKEYPPRPCEGCGEMFVPIRKDQAVASGHKACRTKVTAEQNKARRFGNGKQIEAKGNGNGTPVRSDLAEVFRHRTGAIHARKLG